MVWQVCTLSLVYFTFETVGDTQKKQLNLVSACYLFLDYFGSLALVARLSCIWFPSPLGCFCRIQKEICKLKCILFLNHDPEPSW